jgi:hypothetical protein
MLDMRRPPRVTQSDAIFSVILVSSPFNLTDEEVKHTWIIEIILYNYVSLYYRALGHPRIVS